MVPQNDSDIAVMDCIKGTLDKCSARREIVPILVRATEPGSVYACNSNRGATQRYAPVIRAGFGRYPWRPADQSIQLGILRKPGEKWAAID